MKLKLDQFEDIMTAYESDPELVKALGGMETIYKKMEELDTIEFLRFVFGYDVVIAKMGKEYVADKANDLDDDSFISWLNNERKKILNIS